MKIPSIHRAIFEASLAATVAFCALPVSIAVIIALDPASTGLAVAFAGFVAVAVGPWVLLAAYLGALLTVFGARALGVDVMRASRRTHQTVGVVVAAGMTLLGRLLTNDVAPLWLLFTVPAGFVAGSVLFRRSRVAQANDAC
ncbi:MAG TPA: hypothetical protein PK788_05195 [Gemmatimonadaceae bacterium]|nr:hypothetical protein [Gemmatimonadaceae bacterium]